MNATPQPLADALRPIVEAVVALSSHPQATQALMSTLPDLLAAAHQIAPPDPVEVPDPLPPLEALEVALVAAIDVDAEATLALLARFNFVDPDTIEPVVILRTRLDQLTTREFVEEAGYRGLAVVPRPPTIDADSGPQPDGDTPDPVVIDPDEEWNKVIAQPTITEPRDLEPKPFVKRNTDQRIGMHRAKTELRDAIAVATNKGTELHARRRDDSSRAADLDVETDHVHAMNKLGGEYK